MRKTQILYCFGGGDGGAGAARAEQKASEARVKEGLQRINAIFGGGSFTPYNKATTYNAGTQYFTMGKDGTYVPFTIPQSLPGIYGLTAMGLDQMSPEKKAAARQQAIEGYMKQQIGQGKLFIAGTPQQYEGFGSDFYNKRKQAYEGYVMPQLQAQYRNMSGALTNRMANQGLMNSSIARAMKSSLEGEKGIQTQNVANAALGQVQDLQTQIATEKGNLINQLVASTDPSQTSIDALSAAGRFSAPSPMPAVNNLFSNWANLYMANNLQQQYNSQPSQAFNTPMSNPSYGQSSLGSTGRVVN